MSGPLEILDWTVTGVGYGIHYTTLVTYGVIGVYTFHRAVEEYGMPLPLSVLWTYGVGFTVVSVFESLWHFTVAFTHGGNITGRMLLYWLILFTIQLSGIPVTAWLQRKYHVEMNLNRRLLILLSLSLVIYLIWFFAPFPYTVVESPYFPQTVYLNRYVPNVYIRLCNVSLKAVLGLAVAYMLQGEQR